MKKFLFGILLIVLAVACKKEIVTPNNGIYRGVYRMMNSAGDTLAQGVVYLAIFESSESFSMVGDSSSMVPATHGGTYLIDGSSTMQFDNSSGYGAFPDIFYLDTTYNYKFDDVNFELWQTKYGNLHEFKMIRN